MTKAQLQAELDALKAACAPVVAFVARLDAVKLGAAIPDHRPLGVGYTETPSCWFACTAGDLRKIAALVQGKEKPT
jgi:hypothetical protein